MNNIPLDKVESGSGRRGWVYAVFHGRTREEVENKTKEYFRQFDPRGYDTHFELKPRQMNGYWTARVRRFSTCD